MIKQIQLRGISRTPSDRMTADGGCEESLNVHLDSQEIAPTLAAKNITRTLGLLAAMHYQPLYIHKLNGQTNYIAINKFEAGHQKLISVVWQSEDPDRLDEDLRWNVIGTISGAEVKFITSVGNYFILTTESEKYYYLFKEGNYVSLGTQPPEPNLQFDDRTFDEASARGEGAVLGQLYLHVTSGIDAVYRFDETVWNAILNGTYDTEDENYGTYKREIDEIVSGYWERLQSMISTNRNAGFFSNPVLARYAIKLYDGTYIYQSIPFLLGGFGCAYLSEREAKFYLIPAGQSSPETFNAGVVLTTDGLHKATVKLHQNYNIGDWADLIQSIDLFISPDIQNPKLHSKFVNMEREQSTIVSGYYVGHLSLAAETDSADEDALLEVGNFYKIKSFPISDLSELQSGYQIKPLSQDELLVKPTLEDDQFSHHKYFSIKEPMVYNRRLAYCGARVKLYEGHPLFPATTWQYGTTGIDASRTYHVLFYVKGNDGNTYIVKDTMHIPVLSVGATHGAVTYGWLAYPDTKCFKAEVIYYDSVSELYPVHTFAMKEHPRLNCSYAFLGFNHTLLDSSYLSRVVDPSESISNGDAVYEDRKLILLSEIDNPFLFPIANRLSMSGEIIGMATTTKALSTGQFGEFPMYVFTGDGIWALPLTATGSFAASKPLARDVAIDGTISPIDQAIVFVTARGVMLLQGSDISNLSPNMNGEHHVLESEISDILDLDTCPWKDFVAILEDDMPFMAFMKNATFVYDYGGNRLIAFNESVHCYQYTYQIDTQTWHKISGNDIESFHKLNSYPEAYLSAKKHDENYGIYDFTTFLDVLDTDDVYGVIITRPFDLENPDIRKSIRSIRIRGNYNIGDVKYLLLGSMDGLTYGLVHSLHGNSFKSFKLVLLTKLNPTERLSWIDVDFDTRFTNRLR